MARHSRWKEKGAQKWYHVFGRTAGHSGEYPLGRPQAAPKLIALLKHYASIYYCDVAAFCVMGNHYHLVLRSQAERSVRRKELEARARRMYPDGTFGLVTGTWTKEDWKRYQRRLFELSEFMRSFHGAFGRWYNATFDRVGKFWADRFKSVILEDLQVVLDCMLYVELNPVRAGLVERPEAWEGSSIFLRESGEDDWLLPMEELINTPTREEALREYRERLYYRGGIPVEISQEVLESEAARGFVAPGMYRQRLRYWVEGLAVGSEAFIRERLAKLRESQYYRRRKNPIPQLGGIHFSIREQRGKVSGEAKPHDEKSSSKDFPT